MKKNLIGTIFISYALLIFATYLIGTLNNFLASKMILGTLSSGIVMLVCGIIFIFDKSIYIKTKKYNYILILPFVMIFIAGNGELSLELASNRASNLSSNNGSAKVGEIIVSTLNSEIEYQMTDENYMNIINHITNNVDENEGKTVRIRGYAITDAEYITEGYFAVGKYYISCCAADAGFVGILVENADISINKNEWFEIEGELKKTVSKYGEETLYIEPSKCVGIEEEGRYIR